MIYVKISKDIRTYKTKMFWGLTGRQLICGLIGIILGTVLNTFAKKYIGNDLASWLTLIIEVPIFAVGFVSIQGLPAEKFFRIFFKNEIINKPIVVYQNDNVYRYIEKAIDNDMKKNKKKRKNRFKDEERE